MFKYNGLRVIRQDEQVIGQVVKFKDLGFEIQRYYINEYDTYVYETVTTFKLPIGPKTSKEFWKAFKKELKDNVSSLKDVYIEDEIAEMLDEY